MPGPWSETDTVTSSDRVNYFETLAATEENLDFALGLEADRLMNSFIQQADLDSFPIGQNLIE